MFEAIPEALKTTTRPIDDRILTQVNNEDCHLFLSMVNLVLANADLGAEAEILKIFDAAGKKVPDFDESIMNNVDLRFVRKMPLQGI